MININVILDVNAILFAVRYKIVNGQSSFSNKYRYIFRISFTQIS